MTTAVFANGGGEALQTLSSLVHFKTPEGAGFAGILPSLPAAALRGETISNGNTIEKKPLWILQS